MPTIDLGSVVGPQGQQGNTGPQGEQGIAGPSLISASTQTTLTGVLAGDGSTVGVRAVDATPTNNSTNLVSSGGVYNLVKTDVAYAKSTTVNPNLLDNWYFVGGGSQQGGSQFPINQRGQTSYNSSNMAYCIDRWKTYASQGGTAVLNSGYITLTATGNTSCNLFQYVNMAANELAGKTITVSMLDSNGLSYGTLSNVTVPSSRERVINVSAGNYGGIEVYLSASGYPEVFFSAKGHYTINIIAVKFELGDTQTLAHNEGTDANPVWVLNEIPNYGEELRKCQMYFLRIGKFSSSSTAMPIGSLTTAGTTNAADYVVPLPTTMRYSTPSLTYSGTITIYKADGSSNVTVSNLSLNTAYCSNISLHMTATFSPTVTKGTLMGAMILSGSAYVDISCDL